MTPSTLRRIRAAISTLSLGTLTAAGLGCQADAAAQRLSLLQQENMELRQKAQQLTVDLQDAEQSESQLQAEVRALRAEKAQLETELKSVKTQPLGSPLVSTGFEGISGVQSSMLDSGEVVLDVAGDVLFDSGKADLKPQARKSLQRVANVLKSKYAGRLIRIEGHTDKDPIRKSKWGTNERLSAERALAVEEFLAKQGIDKNMMYVAAFGPARPKGSKKDSRRVEIVVLNLPGP